MRTGEDLSEFALLNEVFLDVFLKNLAGQKFAQEWIELKEPIFAMFADIQENSVLLG